MSKYLLLYRNTREFYDTLRAEKVQELRPKWRAWIAEGVERGWLLDAGAGLQTDGRVVNAREFVTDGPYIESKELIGGFSVIQAESRDAAAEHAKGCPILLAGGSVEVRPYWVPCPE